ncbi:MAG: outer-membrane lipoprotein carrier protein LolA [Elusimicrobiota bacterium]|jgi:chaperone LolA|nr:outer-membrane lipoprotein carrier protein LolA [Elusimicrobiota bacterium]
MKKTVALLTYLFLAVACLKTLVFAQSNLDDFYAKLNDAESKIKTLKVDFKQTIIFEETNEQQSTVGTITFKKPDKMHISQKTPQEQHIYIAGTKNVTVYTPENKQAVINKWEDFAGEDTSLAFIIDFSKKRKQISKTNDITLLKSYGDFFVVNIKSKTSKNWIMNLYIKKENMLIEKAEIQNDTVLSEINFSNYLINPQILKSDLEFTVPENVEVINFD